MGVLDRMTQSGVRVVMLAQAEARRTGHLYVTPEHLILGIACEGDSIGAAVFRELEISVPHLRSEIDFFLGRGDAVELPKQLYLSKRVKKICEIAEDEARNIGDTFVSGEHLFLALMEEGESRCLKLIEGMGCPIDTLREILLDEIVDDAERYGGREHIIERDRLGTLGRRLFKLNRFAKATGTRIGEVYDQAKSALLGFDSAAVKAQTVETIKEAIGRSARASIGAYSQNVTEQARSGKLDLVVGRDVETDRVVQILNRRRKNNACLLGEAGVGKTAIVEGLALRISAGEVPDCMRRKIVISVDVNAMIAGAGYRGLFEERLQSVIKAALADPDIILFIDELHTIVGAGKGNGSVDAGNMLKPELARGKLQCVGATTYAEFSQYIERDPALMRRFQRVLVGEPSLAASIDILKGLRNGYEMYHNVLIPDSTLSAAVEQSSRYISDRYLPDKAIDLMDEASARTNLIKGQGPLIEVETDSYYLSLKEQEYDAVLQQKFGVAFHLAMQASNTKLRLLAKLQDAKREDRNAELHGLEGRAKYDFVFKDRKERSMALKQTKLVVEPKDINSVVETWTGIPLSDAKEKKDELFALIHMEAILGERLIGQRMAVSAIARAIRRSRVGLKDPNRPTGAFMFAGPTGTGKTELAKLLSQFFYGSEESMSRFDMSEFSVQQSVSRLIGAPPGYTGYESGGALTEAVRRRPYTVCLFDELEKANHNLLNIFLQVLEDGRLTDGLGRLVDFRNTVCIFTTNAGATPILFGVAGMEIEAERLKVDFKRLEEGADEPLTYERKIKLLCNQELINFYRPEFLNRMDEIVFFQLLTRDDYYRIAKLMCESLRKRAANLGLNIRLSSTFIVELLELGYEPLYGARPLKRAVMALLEDTLATCLVEGLIGKICIDWMPEFPDKIMVWLIKD